MLKAKDLRDKSVDELKAILLDTRKSLFEMTNEAQLTKDSSNRDKIRTMKKEVARLLTIIKEKDVASN
ncbi:MAG: 50S ribosomal protein L29 [Chlamydiota bacterium]